MPTNDPDLIAAAAESLLERIESREPVRLLGVGLEMVPPKERCFRAGSA